MTQEEKDLLEHALINQVEADLEDQEYEALSELIQGLLNLEGAKELLVGYLSDTALENLREGRTNIRY